jgi:hypothetical protein
METEELKGTYLESIIPGKYLDIDYRFWTHNSYFCGAKIP